jgi:hypothetical protein
MQDLAGVTVRTDTHRRAVGRRRWPTACGCAAAATGLGGGVPDTAARRVDSAMRELSLRRVRPRSIL